MSWGEAPTFRFGPGMVIPVRTDPWLVRAVKIKVGGRGARLRFRNVT